VTKGRSASVAGLISAEDMAKRYQRISLDQRLSVMAGLGPAIHVFSNRKDVDARHKAGHDGRGTKEKPRP
jgi:hypothetical protein